MSLRMVGVVHGKMTGLPDYNRPKFNEVEQILTEIGYTVYNPANIEFQLKKEMPHTTLEWKDYMREALKMMLNCNSIFVIKGYETSKGANIEIELAKKLELNIIYEK